MTDQIYSSPGRAVYRHKSKDREIALSWGAGYPPVQIQDHLGGLDPAEFEREGDDPAAGLVDAPEPEPPPAE